MHKLANIFLCLINIIIFYSFQLSIPGCCAEFRADTIKKILFYFFASSPIIPQEPFENHMWLGIFDQIKQHWWTFSFTVDWSCRRAGIAFCPVRSRSHPSRVWRVVRRHSADSPRAATCGPSLWPHSVSPASCQHCSHCLCSHSQKRITTGPNHSRFTVYAVCWEDYVF